MKIYGASKIWHAPTWQELRAKGYNLVSDWMDLESDSNFVKNNKRGLWELCLRDVMRSDIVVLYCGAFEEEMRGAVMEAGHAMALGKTVYCVNTCVTFTAAAHSDVAFTYHPQWKWIREAGRAISMEEGLQRAIEMERDNVTVVRAFNQFRRAA